MTKQVCGECGRPMRLTPEARARKAAAARWGKRGIVGLGAVLDATPLRQRVAELPAGVVLRREARQQVNERRIRRAAHQAGCTCTLCALPA